MLKLRQQARRQNAGMPMRSASIMGTAVAPTGLPSRGSIGGGDEALQPPEAAASEQQLVVLESLRLMQLFCEGQFEPIQRLLQNQPGQTQQHDLMHATTRLFTACAKQLPPGGGGGVIVYVYLRTSARLRIASSSQ